jgi:hypothetical protein
MLPAPVRVRILKQSEGILDGVSLSRLEPGLTYEVTMSLGTFLIGRGAAEENITPAVDIVIPVNAASSALTGGVSISGSKDRADDRRRAKRPPNRRLES